MGTGTDRWLRIGEVEEAWGRRAPKDQDKRKLLVRMAILGTLASVEASGPLVFLPWDPLWVLLAVK